MREDLLSYIRDNKELNIKQKLKLVSNLSMPAIIAQLTSIAMEYIDASMVGRLGAASSASVGLVATSTWLIGSVCSSSSLGYSIQVAQFIGSKEFGKARQVLYQSFKAVLLVAVIIAIMGASISFELPKWLGGASEICYEAGIYFLVVSLTMPFMAFNRLCTRMLQSCGNTKTPGILNSMKCLMDIIFNLFFIFPSGIYIVPVWIENVSPFKTFRFYGFGLGVLGAALGTALAELVATVVMFYVLMRRTPILHMKDVKKSDDMNNSEPDYVKQIKSGYRKESDYVKQIKLGYRKESELEDWKEPMLRSRYNRKAFIIAMPVAFENIVVCGAMIAITRIIAPLGVVAIAANSFAVTAESLCYMPAYGIQEASTAIVGQSIGAGRERLALSFGRITTVFGMAVMFVMGVFMYFAAPVMIGILSPDEGVRQLGTQILRIEAFAEPLFGASIVAAGVLRGAGDTFIPSLMNFFSLWAVRLVLSIILVKTFGLVGVWIAMALELCFRGIIFLVRMERKKWLNVKKGMSL